MTRHGAGPVWTRFPAVGGIARAAVLIGSITVLARVAGFGRTVTFSQTVTTSCLSQAYFTANQIPNIIFEIVAGGALAGMVVPVLAGAVERGARDEVHRTTSALLTWIVVLLLPMSAVAALTAGPLLHALVRGAAAPCSRADIIEVGARMLVVFAPQILLYGVAVVLYGVLQAHHRFTGPALAPLVSSLVVIGAYVAYVPVMGGASPNALAGLPRAAELTLSAGTTLGVLALVVTALVAAWPLRLAVRPTLRFPPGVAGQVRRLAGAGLAMIVAQQVAMLAVVVLTNRYGTNGALADYNYAWATYLLPWAILAVPIATGAFPLLSARTDDNTDADRAAFDRIAAATTRAVVLASCAGAAALAAVAQPAARVFDGGPHGRPEVLARAVLAFAPGLLGYGLVAHLGRVLYACGRARSAALAIVAGWTVVLVADVAVAVAVPEDWVVAALGLGNTIGMSVAGALLLVALARARGRGALAGWGRAALAGLIAGVLGALAGYGCARGLDMDGRPANVGVAALAAVIAGGVFLAISFLIDRRDLWAALSRGVDTRR
ncbi:MAG TPA: lipid II flippase MurJ [Streptosporangiaceae bacterium]|nr:lipid II flippase MurJ [Streptosporangiaceae bacterium]